MTLFIKSLLLFLIVLSVNCFGYQDNTFFFKKEKEKEQQGNGIQYSYDFEILFDQALNMSHSYKALFHELKSASILYKNEKKYYYPNIKISSQTKKYYEKFLFSKDGTRHKPSKAGDKDESNILVNVKSKIWSSGVRNNIEASNLNQYVAKMNLDAEKIKLYYQILKILTKVELTRRYVQDAKELFIDMEKFYHKQLNATKQGVASSSDAIEVNLTRLKFKDNVFNIESNIQKYFKDLYTQAGLKFSQEDMKNVGIRYHRIKDFTNTINFKAINLEKLAQNNFKLRSKYYTVQSFYHKAQGQREKLRVDLVSDNTITTWGKAKNFEQGYLKPSSFVGLNVNYDVYNFSKSQQQKSALSLYEAEQERYDKALRSLKAKGETLILVLQQTLIQSANLRNQYNTNLRLVATQQKEIHTDKVKYSDIAKSKLSLNDSLINLLSVQIKIYDSFYDLMELVSNKVLER